ncbi:MAG: RDD family protein [Bacillota bacterium]
MNGEFCTQCGMQLADNDKFCNSCGSERTVTIKYAGFWIRLGATVLDLIIAIVGVLLIIIAILLGYFLVCKIFEIAPRGFGDNKEVYSSVMYWSAFIGGAVYEIIMLRSKWQATLGKKIVGIKVVNSVYERMTLTRSVLRYAAKTVIPAGAGYIASYLALIFPSHEDGLSTAGLLINALLVLVWYIMIVFDKRKRAGHDRIALTYVVRS